ncbi:MAG TPA: serine hydrolase [Aliidongia sp.]|uniref:serine hydrolase domain-containing protein n=1 Tax=Aliidongia sp. TaxID=1914230 RepID=UPI002DDCEB92|nr:serine hydrolase [Aliidongia sp.]HEV2675946.1 serine hydrolase [Aliidongia sp.]
MPHSYVPTADLSWETAAPEAAGFDARRLQDAIQFHRSHETSWPRSMYLPDGRYVGVADIGDKPEHAAVIGPVRPRGAPNGLILRGGRLVAEWGDTRNADMTFSIAKSYLGILAGLALADGLIAALDRRVAEDVPGPWFASPQNASITWRHLLQQTSEWSGELWGKPDSADHNRVVGGGARVVAAKGEARAMRAPGELFEYNDVRVNLLAACLTHRFGRPLPDVLKERVMDPIGASADWEWHGYSDAFVDLDGKRLRSVSGGGHWGGGMFIGSRDHARMGLLMARDGLWGERRILPAGWVQAMLTPSPHNDQYGLMWWLNGGPDVRYPSATADSVFALGAGANVVWVSRELDLVLVARWIDRAGMDGLFGKVREAFTG